MDFVQSLERSTDEKFLGSFVGISAFLISFCKSTELHVYVAIAKALEELGDEEELVNGGDEDPTPRSILQVGEGAARSMSLPSPVNNRFHPRYTAREGT